MLQISPTTVTTSKLRCKAAAILAQPVQKKKKAFVEVEKQRKPGRFIKKKCQSVPECVSKQAARFTSLLLLQGRLASKAHTRKAPKTSQRARVGGWCALDFPLPTTQRGKGVFCSFLVFFCSLCLGISWNRSKARPNSRNRAANCPEKCVNCTCSIRQCFQDCQSQVDLRHV